MKQTAIYIILAIMLFGCSKTETTVDTYQNVVYKIEGERLSYLLTIADENGNTKELGYFVDSDSVSIKTKAGNPVFMKVECNGYGDFEIELKVNGQTRDYFIGYLDNKEVVFLND